MSRVFRPGYAGRGPPGASSLGGVARWTQTWLSGLAAAGADRTTDGSWPGRRYGLPPEGEGAVATTGSRVAAVLVDLVVGSFLGALVLGFLGEPTYSQRLLVPNAAFVAQLLVLQTLTGQSIGMRLLRIRVARTEDTAASAPGFLPVAVRTLLLLLVLPAVVVDRDGRGLHDKAAGSIVLRAKGSRSFAG